MLYFWNIHPKFSQNGERITPNTVKCFQEHQGKEYFKIKRFAFCLIIVSYLKFLSSKIVFYVSLMPANSYFFPLFEQVGNEAFLLNFGINKTKQKFITIDIKHKEKSSQVTY